MNKIRNELLRILFIPILLLGTSAACAQEPAARQLDSIPVSNAKKKVYKNRYDSLSQKYSPRKAAIRSAILPGLGQIYNKKYWKLPIVYGALGASAGVFIFNLDNYKATRFAYRVKYNMRVLRTDSSLFSSIRDNLKPLSEESLKFYRNQYRRDIDYSVLFFLILWGLNVVDATVDAHLKSFDVSPNLSIRFKPGYSEMARTSGLSLIVPLGR